MLTLPRRRLLQSLGLGAGAALFSPFLRQVSAGGTPPRRFVFVVEGNGIYPYSFLSPVARDAIEAQASGGKKIGTARILYPLYGHKTPLELPDTSLAQARCLASLAASPGQDDLVDHAAVVLGLSSAITGGGHSSENGALSCARATTTPLGPSIDAVLAGLVKDQTPFEAVRLGITALGGSPLIYRTCAFGPGRAAPVITDPVSSFQNLFSSVSSNASAFAQQGNLLSFGRAQTQQALATFGGSSSERLKLEIYLQSLEQLQAQQAKLVAMKSTLEQVKTPDPSTLDLTESMAQLAMQFDLATAALQGGLTNVVVLASATTTTGFSVTYPASFYDQVTDPTKKKTPRHNMHHEIDATTGFANTIANATSYHVELIAKMARQLLSIKEGDGTMLDHTAIVYLSDNGEQHHSKGQEWPMLLVGGKNLGLKTSGRTVVYPNESTSYANHRQVSNLFNTLGHAAGSSTFDSFGLEGSLRIAKGPLSELMT